ncbi:hypothetical protein DMENIID0001_154490 [Sergentomyia squamirostris]
MKYCLVLFVAIIACALAEFTCPPANLIPRPNLYPHETDCKKFYLCSYGRPHEFTCPGGLYFNPEKSKCDLEENVNCDHKPEPTPEPTPEPQPTTTWNPTTNDVITDDE